MPPVKLKLFQKAGSIDRARKVLTGTDLMYKQHNYGIGRVLSKKSWLKHSLSGDLTDCHWLVTRVAPKKRGNFNNSMKAWGIMTWKGKLVHNGEERRIHGINSTGWRMLADDIMFNHQRFPQLSPDLVKLDLLQTTSTPSSSASL